MINLVKQIESSTASTASHSLFMTYCASLPFFERDILPYLQQVGDGRVTVLLDDTQYQASFSDFLCGAGTRYRLHPVRLLHKSAIFHPKLYLLVNESKADLIVGSGNLTPSGFRANVEIVDQLTISEESQKDAPAIAQYAAMLRLLPKLDQRLPNAIVQEIDKLANDLGRLGAHQTGTEIGPWFLHSIEESLLSQVAGLIPPSEIKYIAAISPFFDENSLAILRLAAIYQKAKIRLIKSAERDSLNGVTLSKLGHRIAVEEWRTLSDHQHRRLHAKALILRSDTDEWLISGSANLTRSAWLSSAMASDAVGNVEAIVVRRFPLGHASRLLKSINAKRIDHESLRRAAAVTSVPTQPPCFTIVDAELHDQEVVIRVEVHSDVPNSAAFRIHLEQNSRRFSAAPHATAMGSGIRLSVNVQTQKLDCERPIIATVEMNARGRQFGRVRTWVSIPTTLAFNSRQRNIRNAARHVCGKVYNNDEAAVLIGDVITRFLTDLGSMAHQQDGRSSHDQTQPAEEGVDRQLSKEAFIISDHALGALQASHARTVQALSGVAALLERLLMAADDLDTTAAPADNVEEPWSDEEQGTNNNEKDNNRDQRKRKLKKAEEGLAELNTAFRDTVTAALRQELSERAVPFVLNLPNAVIAFVLLHAQIRRRLELDGGHIRADRTWA